MSSALTSAEVSPVAKARSGPRPRVGGPDLGRWGGPITVLSEDRLVSQRLEHADVDVTMRVYQRVTAQDDRAAADGLGRALGDES